MFNSIELTRPKALCKIALVVAVFSVIAFEAQSQCGCNFTIPAGAGVYTFDGIVNGVVPGNVICISAGTRDGVKFTNVNGTAANYITVKNCGSTSEALIGNAVVNNAMAFGNCHFIHVTGTGDGAFQYGIKILGSGAGTQGLVYAALSSDVEIDHIEVQNTGYTGLMLKTDPSRTNCLDVSSTRPNFMLTNVSIHDNFIHDTNGEGIYLGDSFYSGTTVFCGQLQYCHEVRHVRIFNNRFDHTGREAIQVGSGTDDIEVHNNVVYNYGQGALATQNGGIQFGVGTSGRMYDNFVKAGPGPALVIQGLGNTFVYNNIVVNPGEQAVTVNMRPSPLTTDIVSQGFLGGVYVINNTFIGAGASGTITEFINGAPGNVLYNNLIVAGANPWDKLSTTTAWTKSNNVYIPVLANANFNNPGLDDYHLTSTSPAVNTGKDVSSYGFSGDFDNVSRPAGASWDVGAFELNGNQKPNVTVGANQSFSLPTNSTSVTGSASDPDGSIASYLWTKQSGPTVTITNATTTTVSLANLITGVYTFRLTATDNGGATGFSDMTVTVIDASVNQSPVANAGADKTIALPTSSTTLSGSASDPDGTIVSYAWTKVSGPVATLANANTASLGLSALLQGTYVFRLTATDNLGATASDDATILVQPATVNQSPVANAGLDKNLVLPTNVVTLSGSGSDPDGSISSYAWITLSGGTATLTNANTATLQLTGLAAGTYTFRLTVTDNLGASAFDDAIIIVSSANQSPVANAGPDKTIQLPTTSTTLAGSGSDADGSVVSYLWSEISGPSATLTNTGAATLTLTGLPQGVYVFRLTVQDNVAATGSNDMRLTVVAANVAPTANAGPTKNIILPVNSTTLAGSGTDPDGTIAAYSWLKVSGPSATLVDPTAATLSLTGLVMGTYVFQLTVTDDLGANGTSAVTVVVFPAATNQSPVVNAGPDVTLTLPTNNTILTASASDPDGAISSYLWIKVSGPAATLSGSATATLTLSNLVAGPYLFRVTVTDNGGSTASDDVNINFTNVNQNPLVNAGLDQIIVLPTSTTSLQAVASDPDGTIANYLWSTLSGPGPVTLTGATTSTLTVDGLIVGTYIFRITVTDNNGGTAADDVNVSVQTAGNSNPIADAGPDAILFLPTNVITLTGSGSDPDGTVTSYAWTQVAGGASTLANANTKILSVSGLVTGTYTFRLTVTDNGGATGIDDATVIVNSASTNQPPVASAGPDIALTLPVNSTNLIGSGSDADGAISSFSWIKLSGPPSATVTNANTAVLSLQDLVQGIYIFGLTVTDFVGATSTDNVQVTVLPVSVNQTPVVDAGKNIAIILPNNAANLSAVASDPDGSIVSYSWTKQIGPTAILTGETTPTLSLSNLVQGSYVFRITVTDNQSASSFAEVTVNVLPAGTNQMPLVNAGPDRTIFLPTNSANLSGLASDDGSIVLYSWVKIGGPPGVTLTNATSAIVSLSGLVAGQYVFRLTATDNAGATSFDEVTVTVFDGAVNQSPIAIAGGNQTIVFPNTTTTLNGSGFDVDGSIVSYKWIQKAGPPATLQSASAPTLIVSALSIGIFQFQLTVMDDLGASGADIATISVVPAGTNQPPVANAGTAQVLHLPANSITLIGSGSDTDGIITSFDWFKKSGPASVTLAGQNTASLSLTDMVAGTYQFTLTVTDDGGLSNSTDVTVTVLSLGVNQNPIVTAGNNLFLRLPQTTTTITAVASDPDGSIAAYLWTKQSGPLVALGGTDTETLSLSGLILGMYTFRIEVTDNLGSTTSADVMLTVLPAGSNQPPVVDAGVPVTISLPLNAVVINGSVSDTDGSIASLVWTQQGGPTIAALSGINSTTLNVQNLSAGIYTLRVTAIDNEGATAFSETTIDVIANHVGPVVRARNDTTLLLPNNFIALTGSATATDGFITNEAWTQIDGPPAELNGTFPVISVVDMVPGVYTFLLTATDNAGLTSTDEIVVTVKEGKSNPIGASIVFSPNGDAINDVWTVKNEGMIQGCPFVIYNNLGKKVFETDQYHNDWNGTVNGQPVKEGDYYFVFNCGSRKIYSGAFRIFR
jgi:gliding motility-associated-like protein